MGSSAKCTHIAHEIFGIFSRVLCTQIPIPAVGFSPLVNTIAREHADNEYLNINTYLSGINVFAKVMTNLASV